ncbi:ferric reductase-like transmembrane domain-containing protein [Desulfuribacillus alkaliarsenatis]|uniref:Ferric oxidoreductase domain-containing protein n=1 Tax=Desulfuribacillus alkaliarsenatis TaxID=766136 RepID=A0A1E5G5X8_9FIRM|nr:ferric reductase-like transmembrane domain-containing protein [Desulfuribacillus alkaliarsenatis]OEF98582.1 hypothetical protein BHF68_02660 [Desulfuribacillus alkaliarsenatis]
MNSTIMILQLAQILGIVGFIIIFLQFVTSSNIAEIIKFISKAQLLKAHRRMGIIGFVLILLHPIIVFIYYDQINVVSYINQYIIYGLIAFSILVVTVLTTIFRNQLNVSAYLWKRIHRANYLVFPIAFIHSISVGTFIQLYNTLEVLWYLMFLAYVAMVMLKLHNNLKARYNKNYKLKRRK